ncbi:MAG: hypothetical protein ABSH46_02645 [Bryobacteraceae bacterium]|jgi:hypothetical protein
MTAFCSGFLLIALLVPLNAAELTVSVRNVRTTISRVGRDDVSIDVRFDAILSDQKTDLHIDPQSAVVVGADHLLGQRWARIFSGETVARLDARACADVPDSGILVLPDVRTAAFITNTDKDAPSHLIARFHIETVCTRGDKSFFQWLVTEPVDIKIPKWDEGKTGTTQAK